MSAKFSDRLPAALSALIAEAATLLESTESRVDGSRALSLEDLLRKAIGTETNVEKLRHLSVLLDLLIKADLPEDSEDDAACVLRIDEAPLEARLTLLPPRAGGSPARAEDVMAALAAKGVTFGVREAAVRAACDAVKKKRETIHRLLVAAGTPAQDGQDGQITFAVRAFDKRLLLNHEEPFFGDLAPLVEEVKAGTIVARVVPSAPARPGRDVKGNVIPATPGAPLPLAIGEGLQPSESGPEYHALSRGTLVVGEETIDLVPFHVVDGQVNVGQDITFDGNVLVTGHVMGPVRIQARDIYVAGNVESASLSATGDVWVGGSVQAKASVEAEGRVLARALSDVTVRALGSVLVSTSILEGRISSGAWIQASDRRGVLEGGDLSAHVGIRAHTIGSPFGILTTLRVGRDDPRAAALAEVGKRIKENEDAILKIDEIKRNFVRADGSARPEMTPDEEMVYISALQKEIQARTELRALRRRRKRYEASPGEGSAPSIVATAEIHPPLLVEVGEVSETIQERSAQATITLGPNRKLSLQKPAEVVKGKKR